MDANNTLSSNETAVPQIGSRGLARTVRPTLLAAVGGTGVAVAKHAFANMEDLLGAREKFKFFAVCAFDTDVQDNTPPQLISNAQFINLSDFNVHALLDAIKEQNEYQHWLDWLPPRLSAQQVSGGVGGVRPKGRLCYCQRRERVKQAIQAALASILDGTAARKLQESDGITVDVSGGIDIHLVSSVCGGTGAGMFLDLAYDVRRWAREVTDGDVNVTGHLVLPGAFTGKPALHSLLMANAYASLQELDRYMRGDPRDPWRMKYSLAQAVQDSCAPFDICYLLDGLGRGGLTHIDCLARMIGEAIALFTVGEVGTTLKARIRNVIDSRLSVEDHRDCPCCYSSYGLISLEIPKELIAKSVGLDLAQALRKQLTAQAKASQIEQNSIDEIVSLIKSKQKRVAEHVKNKEPIIPTIDSIIVEFQIDQDAAFAKLERESSITEEEYSRDVRAFLNTDIELADELQREARRHLQRLIVVGGTSSCRRYLSDLQNKLNEQETELSRIADRHLRNAESYSIHDGQEDIPQRHKRWRNKIKERQLTELFQQQGNNIKASLKGLERFDEAWAKFEGLSTRIELEEVTDEGRYYQDRCTRVAAAPVEFFIRKLGAAKEGLIQDILQQIALEIDQWCGYGALGVRQEIERVCERKCLEYVEKSVDLNCEDLFCDSHTFPSEKFDERLSLIMTHASPLWEIEAGYPLAENKHEISCVGALPTSRFYGSLSQTNNSIECTEEQRPDLIPVFRTEHGISLIGLARLKSYWQAFIRTISEEQRWDFQFFNDCRWITEMEFPDEDEDYQKPFRDFSLLEILGVVQRKDGVGYVQVVNGQEKRLGRTRNEAFTKLKDSGDLPRPQDLPGKDQITQHIDELKERIRNGLEMDDRGDLNLPGGLLKRDVFQIHNEIRALRKLLKVIAIGL